MSRLRRAALAALVTLPLLGAPGAHAYSLLGGRTLGVRDWAVHVQAGFPGLDARMHIPIFHDLELIPRVTLHYNSAFLGGGLEPTTGAVGNGIGANARLRVLDEGRLHLALTWETQLFFNYADPGLVGMKLALPGGVAVDYEISEDIALVASVNIPISVVFHPTVGFLLPIDFGVGAEFMLTDRVLLSLMVELGPAIFVPGSDADSLVGFSLDAMVGVGWLL